MQVINSSRYVQQKLNNSHDGNNTVKKRVEGEIKPETDEAVLTTCLRIEQSDRSGNIGYVGKSICQFK
jgi:hypothetical protein